MGVYPTLHGIAKSIKTGKELPLTTGGLVKTKPSHNKVTRMMRVEAPRQFLPNVRSSGLAFRLALAKG